MTTPPGQGYRPPEPAGARTRTAPAIIIVTLLVLAAGALVVVAGVIVFRVLAAEDEPQSKAPVSTSSPKGPVEPSPSPSRVELSEPLKIKVVTSATPGTCPEGSAGFTVPEPPGCLHQVGGGFEVRELESVSAELSNGQYVVRMRFMAADMAALGRLTGESVGQQMALIYAGEVVMAAQVNGPIEGGALEIAGNYTADEAEELAARLRGE